MGNKDSKRRGPHQNKPKLSVKEKLAKRREKKASKQQRFQEDAIMEKIQATEIAGKTQEKMGMS